MNRKIMAVVVGGLLLAVFILSLGLAYERGHNSGYNEGWNDGRADGIEQGIEQGIAEGREYGWQGCIEENNLYRRYYEEEI